MQGVGLPGLSVLNGAGALVSIDARPLMLAFAICAGAAVYFSLPFEPEFGHALAGAGAMCLLWLAARRWWTYEAAMVEGWVQEVEPGRKGVRLLLRVHSVAGMASTDWPEYVRLTHTSRLEVAPGRFVRCWSVLRPPPGPSMPGEYDFRRQAWFAQLGAVGYVQGRCRGGA